jgi:hypothetical protein
MAKYLSRRIKKTPQTGITSDRYQFLGLAQAEPDLGDPIVGPSSFIANPLPPSGNQYVLASYDNQPGSRYWVPAPDIQGAGLIPGSFTILNNGVQVGLANSFNRFNFVGVAVTVDPVGVTPDSQTGIATVRIQVIDVTAPGDPYEIPFHDPVSGFLRGATDFVFRDDNVGIGTTLPSEKLEIVGNLKVNGEIYSGNIIAGVITALDVNAENFYVGYIGINTLIANTGIITSLFAETGIVTSISGSGLTYTDANITNLNVINGITTSLITKDLNVTGIATIAQARLGVGATVVTVTESGRVGIGSTLPQTPLDVSGDIKVDGAIRLSNGTGTVGQIVISNGSSPASWGNVSETTVGAANSISVTNINDDRIYYPTFTNEFDTISSIYVDATSLVYNPSTNRLGIGSTAPQYSLDVVGDGQFTGTIFAADIITRGTSAEEVTRSSSGIVTTNSLLPAVVDTIGITTFRSAKYVVQVTSNNSLGLGSTISVKNLNGGLNYFPGVYSDVLLTPITGIGSAATATLTVVPQFNLNVTSSSGGIFTFSNSTAGIETGQTLYFNKTLDILPLEQSKLTEIQLITSGFGYTTIPNVIIGSPIIPANPVPGVSLGITATAVVNSMIVKDFDISVGIATTAYPTVLISGPAVGSTATGVVGVGVSEIDITNVGSGYTVSPQILIPKVTNFSGIVGLGISDLNWNINGGSGYSSPPTIEVIGQGGIGTGAVIEADIDADPPNGLINFSITNTGFGYTVTPTVSITGGGGIDAAISITTMIVTDVIVENIGFGATTLITESDIIISPVAGVGTEATAEVTKIIPTNVVITNTGTGYTSADLPVTATFSDSEINAEVSLGVEQISLVTTGLGYTVLPSITFTSPTLGIGSTATALSTKLGYNQTALFNGPGFGGTEAVYYIRPLTSTTFGVSLSSGGDIISLGYSIPASTVASIGGTVSNVNITFPGSNYNADDILTAINFDSTRIDTNTGIGFSFKVNSVVNNFQLSDLILLQTADSGNPNAYVVESSGIADVLNLGDFSADISGQNARLIFNPVFANNTLKYYRTAFVI